MTFEAALASVAMRADAVAAHARQNLLILYTSGADLEGPVVAWSRYDGAPDPAAPGSGDQPPYPSVVAAMQDGWRVLQVPMLLPPDKDDPYTASHLRHEFVLEKIVEVQTDGR
jgi:hypothetical protein